MHKIVVATDDCLTAIGLAQILTSAGDLQLAETCFDMNTVGDAVVRSQPDVVLLDSSSNSCLSIVTELQKIERDCRICLWARHIPSEVAYQAMAMGIRGILRRPVPAGDILTCLRSLCRNEVWFDEHLMTGFFTRPAVRLTKRESELVTLLAQGMKNKEIAYALSLSEGTVKVYLSRLFGKLQVKDRLELALYGIRNLTSGYGPEISLSVRVSSTLPAHTNSEELSEPLTPVCQVA